MTNEEILKIAREAGFQTGTTDYQDGNGVQHFIRPLAKENIIGDLLKFAAAMVLIEREECAKICESLIDEEWPNDDISLKAQECANEIRNREAMKS